MTCGVHGHRRATRRRERVVLGAEQHPAVTLAQRRMVSKTSVDPCRDLAQQRGIGLLQSRAQLVDGGLRTLQVGVEVPEVGLGVAILLAGDLALRHLFDELGRAGGHVERLRPRPSATASFSAGDVLVELVGERRATLGGVLLEQQVLEPVPAGERRVVDAREVVDAGVGLAVDVLDELGDRLDALPRLSRRRVRVLGGLQVARAHGVGEHLDDTHEFVDLRDGVGLVLARRLVRQGFGRGGRADVRRRAADSMLCSSSCRCRCRIAAGTAGEDQGQRNNRHGPGEMQFH